MKMAFKFEWIFFLSIFYVHWNMWVYSYGTGCAGWKLSKLRCLLNKFILSENQCKMTLIFSISVWKILFFSCGTDIDWLILVNFDINLKRIPLLCHSSLLFMRIEPIGLGTFKIKDSINCLKCHEMYTRPTQIIIIQTFNNCFINWRQKLKMMFKAKSDTQFGKWPPTFTSKTSFAFLE